MHYRLRGIGQAWHASSHREVQPSCSQNIPLKVMSSKPVYALDAGQTTGLGMISSRLAGQAWSILKLFETIVAVFQLAFSYCCGSSYLLVLLCVALCKYSLLHGKFVKEISAVLLVECNSFQISHRVGHVVCHFDVFGAARAVGMFCTQQRGPPLFSFRQLWLWLSRPGKEYVHVIVEVEFQ